jgi:hypothetical protein
MWKVHIDRSCNDAEEIVLEALQRMYPKLKIFTIDTVVMNGTCYRADWSA